MTTQKTIQSAQVTLAHSTLTDLFKTGLLINLAHAIQTDPELTERLGRDPVVVLVDADKRRDSNSRAATKFATNNEFAAESPVIIITPEQLPEWLEKADHILIDTNGGADEDAVKALKTTMKKLTGQVLMFTPFDSKGYPEALNRHNELLAEKVDSVLLFTEAKADKPTYESMTPEALKNFTTLAVGQNRVINTQWKNHPKITELFEGGVLPQQKRSMVDDFTEGQIIANARQIWSDIKNRVA